MLDFPEDEIATDIATGNGSRPIITIDDLIIIAEETKHEWNVLVRSLCEGGWIGNGFLEFQPERCTKRLKPIPVLAATPPPTPEIKYRALPGVAVAL